MSARTIQAIDAPADLRLRRTGIGADELADLVRSFTDVTERLQATHASLQERVGRLQSELADANERLRRSRELAALGEMAAGIAHEIRNPLGSIALDVESLRDDLASRPELTGICERVLGSVGRLDQIVGDVLRFARDLRLQPSEIEPREAIDAAVAACAAIARRSGVVVEIGPVTTDVLLCDGSLLVQALVNLVRNGIEATADRPEPRSPLRIEARRVRRSRPDGARLDHVAFRIEDGGPGVPEEMLDRIFHPFFTTRAEGTGLGLAIVHRIADAHGGAVSVRNLAGGGARFELALPCEPDRTSRGFEVEPPGGLSAAVRRRLGRVPEPCGGSPCLSSSPAASTVRQRSERE